MLLKNYQDEAVRELLSAILRYLVKTGSKSLVLKAPTGSGKTVIMQEFLRRLADIPTPWEYAFIWISVNDLSRQSKRSFERNLAGSSLHFSELSDIQDRELQKNEILFINWESINKIDSATGEWKVLAMKDNERDENLPTYLSNTHKAWKEIILIVDESHKNLDSLRAQELIQNFIKPKIQIEVSATPDTVLAAQIIEVDVESVIEAGMIKKEILINAEISHVWSTTDRILISEALKKRNVLIKAYIEEGTTIKPLILIQLPSDSSGKKSTKILSVLDMTKIKHTQKILAENGITLENKKLAIWLSEDKTNKELIDDVDSPVEVLIFKQAIATGWDCPRAQILVMFREMQSIVFQIQTVGRILRMPEQKHYLNHILNTAYVYTDFEPGKWNIGIHETARNFIKNRLGYRKKEYEDINIPSTFLKRVEYRDLWKSFYEVLQNSFLNFIGWSRDGLMWENMKKLEKAGFCTDKNQIIISDQLITNGKIFIDIDEHSGEKIFSETSLSTIREKDLVKMAFDSYARMIVGPQFTNIARSYRVIIEALYRVLEKYILDARYSRYDIQCFILTNQKQITEILTIAKDTYLPARQAEVEKKRKNEVKARIWNVSMVVAYPEDVEEIKYAKTIIDPFYTWKLSPGEKLFIEEYLEKNENVSWWYKNGVLSEQFFSLVYKDVSWETQNFFPDFIVQYIDGTIGIFDPKDGFTLSEGREKHKALTQYLEEQKKLGNKKIIWWFIRNHWEQHITFYKTISDDYQIDGLQGWGDF